MRGRPRKPKDVKIFQGNPRKEDLSYEEPVATGVPAKPQDLGEYGSAHWDRIIPHVMRWGAGAVDTDTLGSLCQWWDAYQVAFHDGNMVEARRAWDAWIKLGSRFGLSPADRAALRKDAGGAADDFDKFASQA